MYSDLARLASIAAIKIDLHLNNVVNLRYYSSTEDLSERLESLSDKRYRFIDGMFFSEVFWPNVEDGKDKTMDDVYQRIEIFSKDLKNFKELSRDKQEGLRDACIRISMLAQREGINWEYFWPLYEHARSA